MVRASLLALALCLCVRADLTLRVRADGSGDFASVQAALDFSAPGANASLGRLTLLLRGEFRERVYVYSNFSGGVSFLADPAPAAAAVGAAPPAATIIFDVAGSSGAGTFGSFTTTVDCDGFVARGVAFANDARGYNKTAAGQSVALGIHGDRAALLDCALWGGQDTFYGGPRSRVYLGNTFVNGSCDSLFGEGALVAEDAAVAIFDTVTAQKGNGSTAYLFVNSDIVPAGPSITQLGRPWGPLAHTVYKDCYMGAGVAKEGWGDWNKGCTNHSNPHACDGVFYAEYNSTGPGAAPASRVWWSHQLNATEAAGWTREAVLSGWNPLADAAVRAARLHGPAAAWSAKSFARALGADERK